jgi:ABC-type branched-subunit amino acid transport system ATPase component
VTALSPSRRATLGLGRTFQRMELWGSLSVGDNVRLGREARYTGSNAFGHVWNRRSERECIRDRAEKAMQICGISGLSEARPNELSTGQRRLVELARAVAAGFTMLLLDEPSSGLDQTETEKFASVLRLLMSEEGVGILLVEHDMTLVMSVCSYIYVLDFGKPLFEGTPAEVASSADVRSAYLGSTAVEAVAGA